MNKISSLQISALSLIVLFGAIMFLATSVQGADSVRKLSGTYAFVGESGCLVSRGGFDANDNAIPLPGFPTTASGIFHAWFSVEGTATFNSDGTGVRTGKAVSTQLSGNGNSTSDAQLASFSVPFTYTVAPDGTINTVTSAHLTGTVLTGDRTGQTFTVDVEPLVGHVAKDGKTILLASASPVVETQTYSNGDVFPRICHRDRVLTEI